MEIQIHQHILRIRLCKTEAEAGGRAVENNLMD
jgi:hypothetical protein